MADELRMYVPFEKVDKQPDGTLMVHTRLNDEMVDDQGERVTYEAIEKAAGDYLQWANVREMHDDHTASGTMVSLTPIPDERAHDAVIHVVDPTAITKVLAKVYKGTSLGGYKRRIRMTKAADGSSVRDVTEIDWRETSLVDRPSRPSAVLTLMKRSDLPEPGDTIVDEEAADAELAKAAAAPEPPASTAPEPPAGDVYLGEDGKPLPEPEPLAKRDISTDERKDIPAADFAGKDKSFPIEKPGDIAAAASSIGRAGSDNYSSDKLKSRIMAIAKRKGQAFMAKLPKAWRDEMGMDKASSAQDANAAMWALQAVNSLLEDEAEEGDDADVAFLRGAQSALLSFVAAESAEIGTPDDEPDEDPTQIVVSVTAMQYATAIGDLRKATEAAQAILAIAPSTDSHIQAAGAPTTVADAPAPEPAPAVDPSPEPLEKAASATPTVEQIVAAVRASLGPVASEQALTEMATGVLAAVTAVREDLAKIAAQPASGGPLMYAPDARRFAELLDGRGGPRTDASLEAEVLAKVAAAEKDPITREALGLAAAKAHITAQRGNA